MVFTLDQPSVVQTMNFVKGISALEPRALGRLRMAALTGMSQFAENFAGTIVFRWRLRRLCATPGDVELASKFDFQIFRPELC
jgi:hypothetical protein